MTTTTTENKMVTPKSVLGARYMPPHERYTGEWDSKGNYIKKATMEEVSWNAYASDRRLMQSYWNEPCVICHATMSDLAGMLIIRSDKKYFAFFFINNAVNDLGFNGRSYKKLDLVDAFGYFERALKPEEKTICDEDMYMKLKKTLLLNALEDKK